MFALLGCCRQSRPVAPLRELYRAAQGCSFCCFKKNRAASGDPQWSVQKVTIVGKVRTSPQVADHFDRKVLNGRYAIHPVHRQTNVERCCSSSAGLGSRQWQGRRHPEGAYYLEWREGTKRTRLSVGNDAATTLARASVLRNLFDASKIQMHSTDFVVCRSWRAETYIY